MNVGKIRVWKITNDDPWDFHSVKVSSVCYRKFDAQRVEFDFLDLWRFWSYGVLGAIWEFLELCRSFRSYMGVFRF